MFLSYPISMYGIHIIESECYRDESLNKMDTSERSITCLSPTKLVQSLSQKRLNIVASGCKHMHS